MPALLPPSMQISGIAPSVGAGGGVPGVFIPPPQIPLLMPRGASIIQTLGASTSASGPTNITQTVTSTQVGTTLVWVVAVNASAAAALGGTPTGWTLLAHPTAQATLDTAIYVYPNNPGAITSVTFSSNATATTGGIAAYFYELGYVLPGTGNITFTTANGSSTSPGSSSPPTLIGNGGICIGYNAWVATPTWTGGCQPGVAQWTQAAQQTSTAGTTNAALQVGYFPISPYMAFTSPNGFQYFGTLSVSAVWAGGTAVFATTAVDHFIGVGGIGAGSGPQGVASGSTIGGLAVQTNGQGQAGQAVGMSGGGWNDTAPAKAGGNGFGY